MIRTHGGYTCVVPIKDGNNSQLRTNLKKLQDVSFHQTDSVLFASAAVIPKQNYFGEELPASLVFATTYCGSLDDHLLEISKFCYNELFDMFIHCQNFPGARNGHFAEILLFLKQHKYSSAFWSKYNGITKEDIVLEKKLYDEIQIYLDSEQKLINQQNIAPSAEIIKKEIKNHIISLGTHNPLLYQHYPNTAEKIQQIKEKIPIFLLMGGAIWFTVGAIKFFVASVKKFPKLTIASSLIIAAVAYMYYRYLFYQKTQTAKRIENAKMRRVETPQLHPVLNTMIATGPIKRGRVRRWFYSLVLKVVKFFPKRFLSGIPTINNIRWLVSDNDKRLIFLSTYSNTAGAYVRDFLNGSIPSGVNFMFNHGQGFPDTQGLYKGGIVNDPEGYMQAVYAGQQVIDFWYAHHPNSTSDLTNKYHQIRVGLLKDMNECESTKWLNLL